MKYFQKFLTFVISTSFIYFRHTSPRTLNKMNIIAKMRSNLPNKKSVINYLHKQNYRCIMPLGSGGFGDVFAAISPQQMSIAVKVIPNRKSWELEDKIWPTLRHPNILPVTKIIEVKNLYCKMYVTPRHPSNLHRIVQSFDFKKDGNGLRRMKKWFAEILLALDYLHSANYCHLDLKGDNVLISMDDSAVLCDFSGLNLTGIHLKRLVAPKQFRPPECFSYGIHEVEGVRFDMWCYGLLVLNEMTDYYVMRQTGDVCRGWSWKSHVKPVLKEILQELHFNDKFDKMFEYIWVSEEDKMLAFDFLKPFLNFNAEERPIAAEALRHPFLKEVLQNNARDFFSFEVVVGETNLSECHEAFAEMKSKNSSDKSCAAAEFNVSRINSPKSCEDVLANLKIKQIKGKVELKHDNTSTELCSDVLEDTSLVIDIKEQKPDVIPSISVKHGRADVESENLSTNPLASSSFSDSNEYLKMMGDYNKSKKKIPATKKWFKKKFDQVFKNKEQRYKKIHNHD